MAIAQKRIHDIWSEKAEPDDAAEVGAPDAGFPGELHPRTAMGFEHHLPNVMRLAGGPPRPSPKPFQRPGMLGRSFYKQVLL